MHPQRILQDAVNERAVRILLECILVISFSQLRCILNFTFSEGKSGNENTFHLFDVKSKGNREPTNAFQYDSVSCVDMCTTISFRGSGSRVLGRKGVGVKIPTQYFPPKFRKSYMKLKKIWQGRGAAAGHLYM